MMRSKMESALSADYPLGFIIIYSQAARTEASASTVLNRLPPNFAALRPDAADSWRVLPIRPHLAKGICRGNEIDH